MDNNKDNQKDNNTNENSDGWLNRSHFNNSEKNKNNHSKAGHGQGKQNRRPINFTNGRRGRDYSGGRGRDCSRGRGSGQARGRYGGRGRGQAGERGGGRGHGQAGERNPSYIPQLIRFNKKQGEFSSANLSVNDATNNGFINIAQQVNHDPNSGKHFRGQSLAMLFTGASKYKIKFHHWETNQSIVWNLLIAYTPLTNSQQIANILNSLSKMRRGLFHVMDEELRRILLDAIDRNVNHDEDPFNSQGIANTLLALDQMGLKWNNNDLTPALQSKLLVSVDRNANGFNSQNIANTLLALVEMQIPIADLHCLQLIRKLINQVGVYLNDEDFIIEAKDQVALALTWLLHTEYCLSRSTNTTTSTSSKSRSSCIDETCNIEIDQAEVLEECRRLAHDLAERHYNAQETGNITISDLQKDVFTCLKLMITKNTNSNQASCLREEHRLGVSNCVSVDIFIPPDLRCNENIVTLAAEKKGTVIEVNGPSHFSIMDRHSNKYEYNIQTLKKKDLLEAMGYIYIDIPYYEWCHLKRDKDAKVSYLKNKLQM